MKNLKYIKFLSWVLVFKFGCGSRVLVLVIKLGPRPPKLGPSCDYSLLSWVLGLMSWVLCILNKVLDLLSLILGLSSSELLKIQDLPKCE